MTRVRLALNLGIMGLVDLTGLNQAPSLACSSWDGHHHVCKHKKAEAEVCVLSPFACGYTHFHAPTLPPHPPTGTHTQVRVVLDADQISQTWFRISGQVAPRDGVSGSHTSIIVTLLYVGGKIHSAVNQCEN